MQKHMPIGIDDFETVRKGYYFVDKTPFLSDFLPGHPAVLLLTRPRRFGKTLLLSMLRYFFDIEGAEEHRKLFDGLAVSRDAAIMAEQGTRPVLFLTLRGWKARDWGSMQENIINGLQSVAREHKELLESNRVDDADRDMLQDIYRRKASIPSWEMTLVLVLRMLEAYYGRKPILLLDEYDVPIQSAWEHDYYDEAIDFFREFLTMALKTNPSLDFAVLTGVLRISKESIFSDLNNLEVDGILRTQFPDALGFTEAEIEKMATDLGHADKIDEIRKWYDGYRFQGHEIYNPWSVVNYFRNDCEPDAYWVNTSGNAILGELMKSADSNHAEAVERLMKGETVQSFLRAGVIYSDIGEDEDALYTLLCMTGYLTVVGTKGTSYEKQYDLRLPNREMKILFSIEIVKRYQKGLSKSALVRLMNAFLAGDIERVQYGLTQYLKKVVSAFDGGSEAFYHGFVLGMLALLLPRYDVRSNRESGYGRYDVAAIPVGTKAPGFVLEFKVAEKEDDLAKKADEALQQIGEREYVTELGEKCTVVRCYGIAFCGKKVEVKMEKTETVA